jgi:hypothetical protein
VSSAVKYPTHPALIPKLPDCSIAEGYARDANKVLAGFIRAKQGAAMNGILHSSGG